jgi:hypothetical protein
MVKRSACDLFQFKLEYSQWRRNIPLVGILATSNLGGLNSTHLGDPSRRGLDLPNGANLVAGISWDANVVTTLQGELNVTDLELLGTALLGVLTRSL